MTIPDTRPAPGRHRAPDAAPSPAPWIPQQGPRSPHSGGWPTPIPSRPFPAAPVAGGHPRSATSGPVLAPMRVAVPAPRYGHQMPPAPVAQTPVAPTPVPPAPVPPAEDDPPTRVFRTQPGPVDTAPPQGGPTSGAPTPGAPTPGDPSSSERSKRKKWPWVVGALGVLVLGATIAQSGETTAPTPAVAAATSSDDTSSGPAAFGQQVGAGDVTVTAAKPVQRTQELIGTQYCSTVTLTNNGSSTEAFAPFDWKFRTSAGVETTAGVPFNADKALTSGTLRPGGTVSGEVCADTGTTGVTDVVYSPGFGILHEVTFGP